MIPPVMIDGGRVPDIVQAGRFPLADRAWCTLYRSPDTHALHIHGYHGRIRLDGADADLAPGTATLSVQDGSSWYDLEQAGWHWVVHFRARPGALAIPAVAALGADATHARSRMAHIAALHARRGEAAARIAAGAALLDLAAWLVLRTAAHTTARSRGDAAIERVAALVREEPDRPWRSGELARRVGLSPNWLAARFRARFGMTIDRYRLQQRIEMARILLGSTTMAVAEVGRRVGLPDPQHFNKVFRSIVGAAPSACRGETHRPASAIRAPGPVRGVQGVR